MLWLGPVPVPSQTDRWVLLAVRLRTQFLLRHGDWLGRRYGPRARVHSPSRAAYLPSTSTSTDVRTANSGAGRSSPACWRNAAYAPVTFAVPPKPHCARRRHPSVAGSLPRASAMQRSHPPHGQVRTNADRCVAVSPTCVLPIPLDGSCQRLGLRIPRARPLAARCEPATASKTLTAIASGID